MESVEQLVEQEGIRREYQNKLLAIIEVLLAYASIVGLMWFTEVIPGFESWQTVYLGKALLSATLYLALPGVLLFYLHGNEVKKRVFGSKSVKKSVKIGSKSLAVMVPATFAFPVAQSFGLQYTDWGGAAIIAVFEAVAAVGILWMFKEISTTDEIEFSRADAFYAAGIFAVALVMVAILHQVNDIARDIIVALIFIGFMEEMFFRGYMQPRLNMAFGKPFKFLNLRFGWGIVITSALLV